jgi:hypothetical protein
MATPPGLPDGSRRVGRTFGCHTSIKSNAQPVLALEYRCVRSSRRRANGRYHVDLRRSTSVRAPRQIRCFAARSRTSCAPHGEQSGKIVHSEVPVLRLNTSAQPSGRLAQHRRRKTAWVSCRAPAQTETRSMGNTAVAAAIIGTGLPCAAAVLGLLSF